MAAVGRAVTAGRLRTASPREFTTKLRITSGVVVGRWVVVVVVARLVVVVGARVVVVGARVVVVVGARVVVEGAAVVVVGAAVVVVGAALVVVGGARVVVVAALVVTAAAAVVRLVTGRNVVVISLKGGKDNKTLHSRNIGFIPG